MLLELLLPLTVHGLGISSQNVTFRIVGTATSMTLTWDYSRLQKFTMLLYPSGLDTVTTQASGISNAGLQYSLVEVLTPGANVTALAGTSPVASVSPGTISLTAIDTLWTGFPIAANRIYSLCIFVGTLANENVSSSEQKSCGSYHTYATDAGFGDATVLNDRNLGVLLGSGNITAPAADPTRTTNFYNISLLYSESEGQANVGLVAYSTGADEFAMWSAISIGNFSPSAIKMDYVTSDITGAVGDAYSLAGPIFGYKYDNATDNKNCGNDVTPITFGKSTTTPNDLFYYIHFSRPLKPADHSCDSPIIRPMNICAQVKEAKSTYLTTAFNGRPDSYFCVSLLFSALAEAVLLGGFAALL